jgi:plastocyanin
MMFRQILSALALIVVTGFVNAGEIEVLQKDKTFGVQQLKIKVGDSISFKNGDAYNHNVFSLSDAKSFDLGSYPQGQTKKVTFDKLGTVEVECAIHPQMKLTVEVTN